MNGVAPILGIDLGTTNSLVGVVQAGRPMLAANALGGVLTPSAVALRDGEVIVGEAARAFGLLHPKLAATSFKRDMGSDRTFSLGGRSFRPPELSAMVLASLRRDAGEWLGMELRRAVITVPAYFNDLQRQATRDAGNIAGLEVVRLLNEPTAAAIAYGLHQLGRELCAVVLDLGGGTFDVTVLEILEGVIEVRSSAGDTQLGGDDFTAALVTLLERQVQASLGTATGDTPEVAARLREAAERAKAELSRQERSAVALPELELATRRRKDFAGEVSRKDAETAWQPLLARLHGPIHRALQDAGLEASEIDEVLLVGGATRMPGVRRVAAEIFGRLPTQHVAVDEVVAHGAALQAALHAGDRALDDLVVTDVAPFTLGVESVHYFNGRRMGGIFTPILERGTVIPASRSRLFSTEQPGQTQLDVTVYQGEHSLCRDNRQIGELVVENLPISPTGERYQIDVRFTYDLNGLLEVEVSVPALERTEAVVLQDTPDRLSPEQVEAARAAMQRLKFHPRDALPNTAALARAEALHVELTGAARERLAAAMTAFRAALESHDAEVIRSCRERLLSEIGALR